MDKDTNSQEHKHSDKSGRDRLLSNVLFNWGSHFFIIISGFILPRTIDDTIGQVSLGIWDFCWSLVNYFKFTMLGITSSINRYVAKYRSVNDVERLRGAVTSVLVLQTIVAIVVISLTAICIYFLPRFLGGQDSETLESARWVVWCLGLTLSLEFSTGFAKGIITGCHRWDLLSYIITISHCVCVTLMIVVLYLGGELVALGVIYLVVNAIAGAIKIKYAFKICPELIIRPRYFTTEQAKKMFLFGGKTFLADIPNLVIIQTTNIAIVKILGPAALAIFARPFALIRHFQTLITRFTFLLTPTASSLQSVGKGEELKEFFIETSRYGVAIALPGVIFFSIYGDILLNIWMGSEYANGEVLALLAAGYFLPLSQNAALRIIIGLNLHGKIGIISFVVTLTLYFTFLVVAILNGLTLINAAIVSSIPLTIGSGILIPLYACKKLQIGVYKFIKNVFSVPILCSSVFTVVLYGTKYIFRDNMYYSLLFGMALSAAVIIALYWCLMIPANYKDRIKLRINKLLSFNN